MSRFAKAHEALKEIPVSAVARERLVLALDDAENLERKVGELQIQLGKTEALLEREREDHKRARSELEKLQAEHAEDVRIFQGIEFRRGKRTCGEWTGFCPKCHLPVMVPQDTAEIHCSDGCGWTSDKHNLHSIIAELANRFPA